MVKRLPKVQVGDVFGRLTVTGNPYSKAGHVKVPVTCICGNTREVSQEHLRSFNTVSCGCFHKEITSTHKRSKTPLYKVWHSMKSRCTNPLDASYKNYGGRGLTISEDWKDFEGFYKDMKEPLFEGASLERLDNEKGYMKGNVIWSDNKTQARNRRTTKFVVYRGERVKFIDLVESLNLNYKKVISRINEMGWSVERAVETP